ncbi:hypothetical protein D7D52_31730 [Nocardia yunnanensis]|uniref:MFS transporter n=1 Tax=Nocardia yunnanensis TaxID=2382165 RepID=A0A386ZJN1_9NOCA|nr:hypothetical protein [Nocardia yunnanensis]AYF77628.1 hypothetical protein D7D52_31730 [Nocardia yunnanensis]
MTIRGSREIADVCTAFLAALIAGLSLMVPIDFAWTSRSSVARLGLLAFSLPQAIAAGALIAIVTAVLATALGGQSLRWGVALGGAALLFVNHLLGRHAVLGTSLATLNFLDSIAGGLVFGGSGAAVLARSRIENRYSPSALAWLLGAIAGVALGEFVPAAQSRLIDQHFPQNWPALDSPPLWLITLALLVIGWRFLREPGTHAAEPYSIDLPIVPIIAGALMIGVSLLCSSVLARHGDSVRVVAIVTAVTVVTALLAAFLLPGRDGSQVLLAVALAGVGSAVLTTGIPGWSVVPLMLLVAAGLLAGTRWPAVRIAAVGLLGLAAFSVLEVAAGHPAPLTGLGHALLALLAGYSFGAVTPRYGSTRVLGIAMIYMPSPVLALRDYTRRGHCLLGDPGRPCGITDFASFAPGWMAAALAAGCAAGLWALLRRRPQGDPAR